MNLYINGIKLNERNSQILTSLLCDKDNHSVAQDRIVHYSLILVEEIKDEAFGITYKFAKAFEPNKKYIIGSGFKDNEERYFASTVRIFLETNSDSIIESNEIFQRPEYVLTPQEIVASNSIITLDYSKGEHADEIKEYLNQGYRIGFARFVDIPEIDARNALPFKIILEKIISLK